MVLCVKQQRSEFHSAVNYFAIYLCFGLLGLLGLLRAIFPSFTKGVIYLEIAYATEPIPKNAAISSRLLCVEQNAKIDFSSAVLV